MATFGLVVHHERPEAFALAAEIVQRMEANGHKVCLPIADAQRASLSSNGVADSEFASVLDVAVSLGGDGSMLRAVHLVSRSNVPVIGVNLGQLGYLTEVEPAGVWDALERFLAADFEIEERMLLSVSGTGDLELDSVVALNEAVLEKTTQGPTVRLDVSIDGQVFTPYAADGLIVATPTGSTAYNLSARGPIVAPTHRAIIVTPVSPHMLFDRSLVLEPETTLQIVVSGHYPARLAVDGRTIAELAPGAGIACSASTHAARLVTFGPRDFHRILKAKFGLNDR
ncbi:MAG: NAD(+)/NADH kinase [Actinomycetes bacterium]